MTERYRRHNIVGDETGQTRPLAYVFSEPRPRRARRWRWFGAAAILAALGLMVVLQVPR